MKLWFDLIDSQPIQFFPDNSDQTENLELFESVQYWRLLGYIIGEPEIPNFGQTIFSKCIDSIQSKITQDIVWVYSSKVYGF